MPKAKVYFTDELTPAAVLKMYQAVGKPLTGRVAVKVHSGEKGNQNYLRPEFMRPMIEQVHGTVVECNTAYDGARNTTAKHRKLLKEHGWAALYPCDLMDAEGPDLVLPIPHGKVIKQNYVGKNLANYDSLLVLSHFKGHPMGGFGGALKQLSIGIASTAGKAYIHSAGKTTDQFKLWDNLPAQDLFLASMADAASSVVDYFHGNAVYINVMCNLSVDCDCCAKAEDPCLPDIGILASTDPVALDQACLDLVSASTAVGRDHFMERVNSRHGVYTIEAAAALGIGTRNYDLVRC